MKRYFISLVIFFVTGLAAIYAANPVKIAAALPDLGSITSYIGGDKVEVFSIAKNNSNPHFVEVLPSYMLKVSRADVYLKCGLSLDQWSDEIISGSRNSRITVVDCSKGIEILQKPSGKVDASMGDVHADGNPHYWLDPANGVIIADNILAVLKQKDPANTSYFEAQYEKFTQEYRKRSADWNAKMSRLSGKKILCYHSSWVYFASAFNLDIAGYVEPLPGIPPTGKHLAGLLNLIKDSEIALLIQEPYFSDDSAHFLNRNTGLKTYRIAPSCADVKAVSYFNHFDEVIDQITR